MTKREFINQVLTLLNEAGMKEKECFQLEGADNSEVDMSICSVYRSAWQKCVGIVPRHWLTIADFSARPTDFGDGTGIVRLPEDWYMLYAFRMQGWKRSVYRCAEAGDEVARMQQYEYARGTRLKPVCVLELNLSGDGKERVLHYYSLPRGVVHEVDTALYAPVCKTPDEWVDKQELPEDERFVTVLCYLVAACVSRIFKNWDGAKSLEQEAVQVANRLMVGEERRQL